MLQFIPQENNKYSVIELTQMAIEAGCGWIQLRLPNSDEADIRAMADELIPLCKEAGVILTIEDRPELSRDLSIHGVHLSDSSHGSPRKVRDDLGPGAIIGVQVADPQSILTLKMADIDYATLDPSLSVERQQQIISDARAAGAETPIVVVGTDIEALLATGADGIAVPYAGAIAEAADPVTAIRELLMRLNQQA